MDDNHKIPSLSLIELLSLHSLRPRIPKASVMNSIEVCKKRCDFNIVQLLSVLIRRGNWSVHKLGIKQLDNRNAAKDIYLH